MLLLIAQLAFSAPVVSIGAVDDSARSLANVHAVYEVDGRIHVLQGGSPFVAIFDSNGNRVRQLGRRGGGPGEFSQPSAVGVRGDTLWVADLSLRKVGLFDRKTFAHLKDMTAAEDPDGRVYARAYTPRGLLVSVTGRSGFLYKISGEGTLHRHPLENATLTLALPGARLSVRNAFSSVPLVFVSLDGSEILAIDQRNPGGLRLERILINGQRFPAVVAKIPSLKISDKMIADEIRRMRESVRGKPISAAAFEREYRAALGKVDRTYAIERVTPTPDGKLWITQRSEGGGSVFYLVDIRTGRVEKSLSRIDKAKLVAGSANYAWFIEYDEDDVQFLRKRLVRGSSK